jgi:hypothetical protein
MTEPEGNLTEHDLKKQSQFPTRQMSLNAFGIMGYENRWQRRGMKSKANQTQCRNSRAQQPDKEKVGHDDSNQ